MCTYKFSEKQKFDFILSEEHKEMNIVIFVYYFNCAELNYDLNCSLRLRCGFDKLWNKVMNLFHSIIRVDRG